MKQEVYGLLLTHYAIRSVTHEAALQADLDPDRLSFLRRLRAAQMSARQEAGSHRAKPRVTKRKMSSWPFERPHQRNLRTPAPTDIDII